MAQMYATSKHAMVGAVRSMGKPLRAEGIQINGLAPSVIGIVVPTLGPRLKLTIPSHESCGQQSFHVDDTDAGFYGGESG